MSQPDPASVGRLFLLIAAVLAVVGLWLVWGPRIPLLGRLPGDFVFRKRNFVVYVPLATSLVVSALLSLLFWLLRKY